MKPSARISLAAIVLFCTSLARAQAPVCDVDADADVDMQDIQSIFAARNQPADADDPRDADGDGFITVNDGRLCVLQCTLPGCASPPGNTAPVADAGPNQTVTVGDTVTLNGSGSNDADGDPLTFAWSIVGAPAGSSASLSDPAVVMPTLVADAAGDYIIELIVNDGTDASAPDDVVVITAPGNTPPVANAGPDRTVQVNDTVALDGSASSDVDGDSLTFAWTIAQAPTGSAATLSDPASVMPSFVADLPGEYVVELVVDDGEAGSLPDTVSVTTANTPPVADAGPDQTVALDTLVQLDGSASADIDGDPLAYAWSLTGRPTGSTASLGNAATAMPTFVADVAGTYVAQLIVNDGTTNSAPDTVVVDTANTAPVANAGADQAATVGDAVTMDGAGSSDADGDALTFLWSFTARPTGSAAALDDPASVAPSFDADVEGLFVLQLIVSDGTLDSAPDTATVTVSADDDPSLALAPATLDLLAAATGTLTVTLSTAAGPSGVVVDLASGNGAIAAVPASVSVAAGATQANFDVTAGSAAGNTVITASAPAFGSDTSTVSVSNRNLAIALDDNLVGVGRTIGGTVTLAQPAPAGGVTVTLGTGNAAIATAAPASLSIPAGAAQGPFTVSGAGAGTTSVNASAPGFDTATAGIEVTSTVINIGAVPAVAPGQSVSLPISINSPAPAGGLTVTLVSADPGIATVDASAFIPAGQQTPASNPQVTGILIGATTVSASAPGFAPDARAVTVTLTLAFAPDPLDLPEGNTAGITLSLSAPAPAGGLTIALAADDTAIATVPANATVGQGETSVSVPVTAGDLGTTTIRANAAGVAEATATVNVEPAPPSNIANTMVGDDLQVALTGSLSQAAPAGNLVVTLTSGDPARVLLGDTATGPGAVSITRQVNAGAVGIPVFYVQALAGSGTADIVATAPGYAPRTFTATLRPSGFAIWIPSTIATNVFADDTTVQLRPAALDPATLNLTAVQAVRGGLTVDVPIASADPAVGTAASPVAFGPNASVVNTTFSPAGAGTTTVSITQPPGFQVPANLNASIPATVDAPGILFTTTQIAVGDELQTQICARLESTPPSPRDLVVSVPDAANLLLSTNPAAAGGASITFAGVANTTNQCFQVQGVNETTAPVGLTGSATSYQPTTIPVEVWPAGFAIYTPASVATDVFAAPTTLQIRSAMLNPATLNLAQLQPVRGGGNVGVIVAAGDAGVGTVGNSPVPFAGNQSIVNASFVPAGEGTTDIVLTEPAGFETPANLNTQIVATVSQPDVLFNTTTLAVGDELQVQSCVRLESPPPSPRDIVVSVPDTSNVRLTASTAPTVEGEATLVFPNVDNSAQRCFLVQGISETDDGTSDTPVTVTGAATGYLPDTLLASVWPAGFVIYTPNDFTTNVFATPTTVQVRAARLQPGTLSFSQLQAARGRCPLADPGCGAAVDLPVTSSDAGVGVITQSPVAFAGNSQVVNTSFDPLAQGTTDLALVQPAGFEIAANLNTSIAATVTAPDLLWNSGNGDIPVGDDLQEQQCVRLGATPPNPVDLVVSVASGTIATLTTDPLQAGATSITFPGVDSQTPQCFYVQGRSDSGTTTLNAQAAGYNDAVTRSVDADPSGFVIYTPSAIDVDALANNPALQIRPARLDPTTLNLAELQAVRGGLTVDVDVSVTNPAVGRSVPNPVSFAPNEVLVSPIFLPLRDGATDILLQPPAGFDTPSNLTQIAATVTGGFAIPAGQTNLALLDGAAASASSQFGTSFDPSEAIDGVDTTAQSWCSQAADTQATLTVALDGPSSVSGVAVRNARGAGFPVTTGRFELYAPGATPGVDTPLVDSGSLAFSADGEIDFTLSTAATGVGVVRLAVESTSNYACVSEIGIFGPAVAP